MKKREFKLGGGAHLRYGSDVYAYTVIAMSPSGKTVTLQRAHVDIIRPARSWGEQPERAFKPDPEGATVKVTLRKDGRFRPVGSNTATAGPGYHEFYDPHF